MRTSLAIEIAPHELRAIVATVTNGIVHVQQSLTHALPADADDAAIGAAIGQALDAAGIARGRATVALSRSLVGLKRLELPSVDPDELPDMTRLALRRELPFDAEQAVIDYVPVEDDGVRATVVAVAAPTEVRDRMRSIARAAGLRIERMTLRVFGAATLVHGMMPGGTGAALIIDVTGDAIEFAVIENGSIRFSRSAAVPAGTAQDELHALVITETRRTWMSYRIVEGSSDVDRAFVLGDPAVCTEVVTAVWEMLVTETAHLGRHPKVDPGDHAIDRAWPLAGLVLAADQGTALVDFARPRRGPQRVATRRRRIALVGALVAVVALLLAAIGYKDLEGLRADVKDEQDRIKGLTEQLQEHRRNQYQLAHLNRWPVEADWLGHAQHVGRLMPPPEDLVLDTWVGTLEVQGVRFDRSTSEWAVPREITIVMDGEARTREAADAFRAALVESEGYVAASSGSDAAGGRRLPIGFTYRLRVRDQAPPDVTPPAPRERAE